MDQLKIGDTVLNYQVAYKNNKNTYFYFKKKGYIQINASKHQKKKDIIKFIKVNSESFIQKYNKLFEQNVHESGYSIWGSKYEVSKNNLNEYVSFNHELLTVKEPINLIDQHYKTYKDEEKRLLLEEANNLKEKYLDNGLIDISKIIIKTRYTTTRFGSCNYRLKTINLNLKLIHYDKVYIEYVFLHEIAHLVHQNHSKDFYLLLGKLCPNYKELKKELNLEFKR